ncbi:hypothetical protein [Dyadobacter fanqingshengii]|uniref:Lipoprotein n=1 Tax=Dyadobacter fanqingshengii TaxID=2906443 RepID=A0A9X1PGH4_9BACT|nr:hypothetical protein [Dyadobacter fanqingshengii]MCF0043298.1 hypothetical protein [Dyadobacter fanqingshengii]USJ35771.1 hypothetical protein NFI81_24160 [Dyadobacter fanqingshengii]
MKYCSLFLLLTLFACNQNTKNKDGQESGIVNDTIPAERKVVENSAVASYTEKVKDPLNDWRFSVDVYETKSTFNFLVKIKYKELDAEDNIKIPNFGIMPKVEVRKGKEELSCIIGFLDKSGEFKEYKLVQVKNQELKISTIKHYARTLYKVKK